jgi:ubiquinone biosynthesis protein UbiJ
MRDDKATLGWPFSLALNRLLEGETEARARLAAFSGSVIEVRAPLVPALTFSILPGGRIEAGGEQPALVMSLKPGFLAALAKGEDYLMREVEVSGDSRLAAEVLGLIAHLREAAPDIVEENLSRVFGDIAARRMAGAARDFLAWQADAAGRVAAAFADYATEESRLLVARPEHASFAAEVARLRDALERLEKRIAHLG